EIARAAGLRARADGCLLPAAERLTLHDGAGDAAIDIEVSGLHVRQPLRDLVLVEGMQARGQTVVDRVHHADRLIEAFGRHDAEHRAEVLREVERAAGWDVLTDAGAPQLSVIVELLG